MKAVIVDDEERSRRILSTLIGTHCTDIDIVAQSNNIDDAFLVIDEHKPDIVFLDIDMPPHTGFDLLRMYETIPFEVIFVTAYDFYAIDAIKFSALYYILKPIKVEELKMAIQKANKKATAHSTVTSDYIRHLNSPTKEISRIIINTHRETEMIELSDINYIHSESVYTIFHLLSGKQVICTQKSLTDYEEMLVDKGFFRVHRSYIVNLREIISLDKKEGDEILLKNKELIPLARRRKEEFLLSFSKL